MPSKPSQPIASEFNLASFLFGQPQVAASQTNAVLKTIVTPATSGQLAVVSYVLPWAGSIIGIGVQLSAAATAGTLAVTPNITPPGGSLADCVGLTVSYAASGQYKTALADANVNPFIAGALLGVRLTSNGSWAPTTADLLITLYIQLSGMQA